MVCPSCGSEMTAGVQFCSRCGVRVVDQAPVATPPPGYGYAVPPQYAAYPQYPPVAAPPRVRQHLQILGILWIVYIVTRLFMTILGLVWMQAFMHIFFHGFAQQPGMDPQAAAMFQNMAAMFQQGFAMVLPFSIGIGVLFLVFFAVVSYGLLTRKSWGRILAIIAAIFALLSIPFGTAIGIYTLWVLAPEASKHEYEALVCRS